MNAVGTQFSHSGEMMQVAILCRIAGTSSLTFDLTDKEVRQENLWITGERFQTDKQQKGNVSKIRECLKDSQEISVSGVQ